MRQYQNTDYDEATVAAIVAGIDTAIRALLQADKQLEPSKHFFGDRIWGALKMTTGPVEDYADALEEVIGYDDVDPRRHEQLERALAQMTKGERRMAEEYRELREKEEQALNAA